MEENANKLHFLITSNIVIHPQILIFSVLKIYVGTFWDTVYIRNMALSFTMTGFARWLLLIVVYNMTRKLISWCWVSSAVAMTVFRMCYVCQVVEAAGDTVDVHAIPRRHETSAETLQW